MRRWPAPLVAALAGCMALTACQDVDRAVITPTSIGPVSLGEVRSHVETDLGRGIAGATRQGQLSSTGPTYQAVSVSYPHAGLTVEYLREAGTSPFVISIIDTSRSFHTIDSARVGDPVQRLGGLFDMRCTEPGTCIEGAAVGGIYLALRNDRVSSVRILAWSAGQVAFWASQA
jgi:hypothetical protein